jgi:hypothetical protein
VLLILSSTGGMAASRQASLNSLLEERQPAATVHTYVDNFDSQQMEPSSLSPLIWLLVARDKGGLVAAMLVLSRVCGWSLSWLLVGGAAPTGAPL